MALRTDYKDDILSSGNLRKYQMINNGDGTVSFQDVTVYQQTGDTFGAGDINNTNQAVNEKLDSDDVVDPMETTVPGFAADALAVKNQFNEQNKKLTDTGWIKAYNNFCKYRAKNGICTVVGVSTGEYTLTKGEYKPISAIGKNVRPSERIYFNASPFSTDCFILGYVDPDGIVYLYTDKDNVSHWLYDITFPVD